MFLERNYMGVAVAHPKTLRREGVGVRCQACAKPRGEKNMLVLFTLILRKFPVDVRVGYQVFIFQICWCPSRWLFCYNTVLCYRTRHNVFNAFCKSSKEEDADELSVFLITAFWFCFVERSSWLLLLILIVEMRVRKSKNFASMSLSRVLS